MLGKRTTISLSVDYKVWEAARLESQRAGMSLSRLVEQFLQSWISQREAAFDAKVWQRELEYKKQLEAQQGAAENGSRVGSEGAVQTSEKQ